MRIVWNFVLYIGRFIGIVTVLLVSNSARKLKCFKPYAAHMQSYTIYIGNPPDSGETVV